MIRKILTAATLLTLSLTPAKAEETIVAVVNDTAISSSDLKDRTNLILLSSGLPKTTEMRERLKPQILNALIDETIQHNEAKKMEIVVDPKDIQRGIDQIAKQNNVDPKKFRDILRSNGINLETLEKQVASQIAWSTVIQTVIRPRIIISDTDVEAAIDQLRSNIGKTEYLTAEIYLPFQEKDQKAKVKQLANRLVSQIRSNKVPFSKVAQQFSGAAGASKGGDLGWVAEGQLSDKLDTALPKIGEGNISNPIETQNGLHILFVRKTRKISEDNIPDLETMNTRIGMERMERQARGYFIDLKSSAYIERRI